MTVVKRFGALTVHSPFILRSGLNYSRSIMKLTPIISKFDQMKLLSTGKTIRDDFSLRQGRRFYEDLNIDNDKSVEENIVRQLGDRFDDAVEDVAGVQSVEYDVSEKEDEPEGIELLSQRYNQAGPIT